MSQSIGDLILKIVVETLSAEKNVKQMKVTLEDTEDTMKKVKKSTSDFSDSTVKLGFVLNTVKEVGYALNSSLSTIFNTIKNSNEAYQRYLSSNRQLEAASKITGANIRELNKISKETKDSFQLTTGQANLFTIELTKLGQKAGDVSKVQESISALMDIGAGQGLDAEQTLYAIKQAILGIDEGTDKLFQKNPSVLYEEYAKQIGTTAGKLSDQQKAQALLDSVMKSGSILNGQYSKYLETAAGKQQMLNTKIEDAKVKLGEQLQPVLLGFLGKINDLFSAFNKLDGGMQTLVITAGTLSYALAQLIPLFSSLQTIFPGIGTAARSAGGVIANVFSKGGVVGIALGATLILLLQIKDLIDEISGETIHIPSPSTNQSIGKSDVLAGEDASIKNYLSEKEKGKTGNEFFTPEEQKATQEELEKTKKRIDETKGKLKDLGKSSNSSGKESIKLTNELIDKEAELIELLKIEETFTSETRGQMVYVNYLEKVKDLKKQIAALKLDKDTIDVKSSIATVDIGLESSIKEVDSPLKKKTKELTPKDKLDEGISAAQNIASILGFGADNFVSKLIAGLNNGISLVSSIAKILSLFGSGGLTGIFSVLGLASGGMVPGSGSGDSVPAMLTPGEFVINKSRAGQLGTGFLQWLNGGGSVQSMAPGAFANLGNTSQVIEVPYIVTHKVEGNDLRTILSRVDKTNNRRKL